MTTRRRFIFMIPASGAVLAAACSDQATPPPAAAPEAAPAAAPMAAPPAPEPAAPPAAPQASGSAPMLDEADAAAVALGYVADTARADKTKYPNHADSQSCANCGLYQGTAGADAGPCPRVASAACRASGQCQRELQSRQEGVFHPVADVPIAAGAQTRGAVPLIGLTQGMGGFGVTP